MSWIILPPSCPLTHPQVCTSKNIILLMRGMNSIRHAVPLIPFIWCGSGGAQSYPDGRVTSVSLPVYVLISSTDITSLPDHASLISSISPLASQVSAGLPIPRRKSSGRQVFQFFLRKRLSRRGANSVCVLLAAVGPPGVGSLCVDYTLV